MSDPAKREKIDLGAFIGRHSKDIRYPEIKSHAQELRKTHSRVGAIGYCYGGWACFQLAGESENLVDAISTAHPSLATKEEIKGIKKPVQIMAPETDPQFTPEMKQYANETIPTLGVEYDYQYFPGLVHGFAVKGDPNDKAQKKGLERAKNAAVFWFAQHLHGHNE